MGIAFTAASKAAKLSGVERSSSTPTMTSVPLDTLRRNLRPHAVDIAQIEEPAGAAMAGGRTDMDG